MDHALHLTSVYTLQFDGAKVIAAEKRAAMSQNLADFERWGHVLRDQQQAN